MRVNNERESALPVPDLQVIQELFSWNCVFSCFLVPVLQPSVFLCYLYLTSNIFILLLLFFFSRPSRSKSNERSHGSAFLRQVQATAQPSLDRYMTWLILPQTGTGHGSAFLRQVQATAQPSSDRYMSWLILPQTGTGHGSAFLRQVQATAQPSLDRYTSRLILPETGQVMDQLSCDKYSTGHGSAILRQI